VQNEGTNEAAGPYAMVRNPEIHTSHALAPSSACKGPPQQPALNEGNLHSAFFVFVNVSAIIMRT
jgi:hypothetical protein